MKRRLAPPLYLVLRTNLLFLLLVLFGLFLENSMAGEEEPTEQQQHVQSLRLRRWRRPCSVVEQGTNAYWDLPADTSSWSSTRPNNPYWQLPQDRKDNEKGVPIAAAAPEQEQDNTASSSSTSVNVYHPHAVRAEERSSASTLLPPPPPAAHLRDNMKIMAQNVFIEQCLTLLESHAEKDRLNRDHYMDFLHEISNNSLDAQDFTDLPLFLAMIFFSASCSSGEDCVTQEPAITVHHRPLSSATTSKRTPENQMNQVLCYQLMRFPFMEILLPFQFLIRVNSGLSASDLMMRTEEEDDDDETATAASGGQGLIVPNLEGALDQVLLRGFNCSYDEPGGRESRRYSKRKHHMPPRQRSQRRQPQPQGDCDFVVQVTVEDAADYPCGFRSSCILIFSDVIVYAVLKDTLDEPKLRKMTSDVLRDAINGNTLNEFL